MIEFYPSLTGELILTKFENICSEYEKARDDFSNYRMEIYSKIGPFFQFLENYLKIPPDNFKYYPIDENKKKSLNNNITLPGAVSFENDSYCHIKIGTRVWVGPSTYPQEEIVWHFKFKYVEKILKSEIVGLEKMFEIDFDNFNSTVVLPCEYIYETMISHYRDSLKRYLESENSSKMLGFDTREINK